MDLRPILVGILNGHHSAVRNAVSLFHHIALAYLRHKDSAGILMQSRLSLPINDLALDCISGLFERDQSGSFCVLRRYYEELRWQTLDEEALNGATRRLIFSAVNQELYRNYKEADPILHRIIRNIKDAADSVPGVRIMELGHENCVVFFDADTTGALPIAPPEYLGPYISAIMAQRLDVRGILAELRDLMASQDHYRPIYPVVRLAVLMRDIFASFAQVQHDSESTSPTVEETLLLNDISSLISHCVKATGNRFRTSYVGRGRIHTRVFDVYMSVVEEVLRAEFMDDGTEPTSFVERARNHFPGLTTETYRSEHRSILEYLVKTARAEYLETVRQHCV